MENEIFRWWRKMRFFDFDRKTRFFDFDGKIQFLVLARKYIFAVLAGKWGFFGFGGKTHFSVLAGKWVFFLFWWENVIPWHWWEKLNFVVLTKMWFHNFRGESVFFFLCFWLVLGIWVFVSGWFGLFGFRHIRVGMFRNHLRTRHFSDWFGSSNVGFGTGFYFSYKTRTGTVL